MTARILLFIILLSFVSCSSPPECEIQDELLVRVLADIHLAESAGQNLMGAAKDSVMQAYYRQVFTIHRMEEADFLNCFELLQEDPERMNLLYEKVLEEISRQGAQMERETPK